jgi:hypothetical protein
MRPTARSRWIWIAFLGFLLTGSVWVSGALHGQELPANAAALHTKFIGRVTPPVRAWIIAEAETLRQNPALDEKNVYATVRARLASQGIEPARAQVENAVIFMIIAQALGAGSDSQTVAREMTMDRRKKLAQALANLIKAVSDTDATLLQNIK